MLDKVTIKDGPLEDRFALAQQLLHRLVSAEREFQVYNKYWATVNGLLAKQPENTRAQQLVEDVTGALFAFEEAEGFLDGKPMASRTALTDQWKADQYNWLARELALEDGGVDRFGAFRHFKQELLSLRRALVDMYGIIHVAAEGDIQVLFAGIEAIIQAALPDVAQRYLQQHFTLSQVFAKKPRYNSALFNRMVMFFEDDYSIQIDPHADGFMATHPEFGQAMCGVGKSLEEAIRQLWQNRVQYLEQLAAEGKPIPQPRGHDGETRPNP